MQEGKVSTKGWWDEWRSWGFSELRLQVGSPTLERQDRSRPLGEEITFPRWLPNFYKDAPKTKLSRMGRGDFSLSRNFTEESVRTVFRDDRRNYLLISEAYWR